MGLTWVIAVDWNNDGTFEADLFSRTYALTTDRGRKSMLVDGKGFARPGVGECVITCNNDDGYFDFLNTSSPIYPNALPGRECYITVNDGVTTYPVFRGRISDILPTGADYSKSVTIKIEDGWASLRNKISYGVVEGADTGTLIGYVLDKAGYVFSNGGPIHVWRFPTRIGQTSYFGPPSWTRSLEAGIDTVDYWWLRDEIAADAIHDLAESEFGLFWFGADGVANFLNRQTLYTQASEASLTQSTFLRTITSRQSLKNMRNRIDIRAYPRVLQNPAVLWKLSQKPLIKAGESLTVWPDFKYESRPVAAENLLDPVAGTDYTANSLTNGTGTDLTANLTVNKSLSGATAEIKLTNTGGTDLYVTSLQLLGLAIDVPTVTSVLSIDAASVDAYQARVLALDLKWQDDPNTAQDFANYLASWLPDFQPFPIVEIENRPSTQFGHDLAARITLVLSSLSINQDFRVMHVHHEWTAKNGQAVKTTWYCEPLTAFVDVWTFPTRIGVTSRFAF